MRFTKKEKELIRQTFRYCVDAPALDWLETLSDAELRIVERLREKIARWT
jgi:hypothetical protein